MKAAVISGIILICLIVFIIINSFLCIGIINELKESVSPDKALTVKAVEELEKHWQKHETFLHIGVNSRYIDSISESILELKAAFKTKSEEEITSSLDMLNHRLDHLKKLNKFNLSNVF